ncbi:hypothetical protein PD280_21475 [Virgibacillus salarius]|uniref:hypothetical protein n=1 Tax=Virgibacillus salarius TaxID=447199 RepID=UPI0024939CCE|nr:hypothetical protein [Virgibacillus salarius]WBX80137.1 hypothetical protein PD280_21475 [Virgibacillus salarius]
MSQGNKKRLKGKEKKLAVMDAVKKHFGFVHTSDNVVDAYILAQIAKALVERRVSHSYQAEVLYNVKVG